MALTYRVALRVGLSRRRRRFFAQFAFRVCPGGVSNFRKEVKGSSKMADGAANQNCSFYCKWPCSRQNCVQIIETNQISPRLRGSTLSAALVSHYTPYTETINTSTPVSCCMQYWIHTQFDITNSRMLLRRLLNYSGLKDGHIQSIHYAIFEV